MREGSVSRGTKRKASNVLKVWSTWKNEATRKQDCYNHSALSVPKAAPLALNLNSARASKRNGRTRSICSSPTARFIAFESFSRESRFYGWNHLEIPRGTCGISVIVALRAKTCLNYASTIAISKGERVHCHRRVNV